MRFIRGEAIDAKEAVLGNEQVLLGLLLEPEQVAVNLQDPLRDRELQLVARDRVRVRVVDLDAFKLLLHDCFLNLPIVVFGGIGRVTITLL